MRICAEAKVGFIYILPDKWFVSSKVIDYFDELKHPNLMMVLLEYQILNLESGKSLPK